MRCPHCGIVNFADGGACRRCGEVVWAARPMVATVRISEPSALWRLGAIGGTVVAILFAWWVSLFATSEGLDPEQQVIVFRAVELLEEKGFSKEVFALRNVARFRSTDNWWNLYNEHYQAYAATNFPFEIVTIYPWFFDLPKDDVERAVILLHEAQHLMGADEETALRRVWALKARLDWTAERYGHSKVWKNTREWTQTTASDLFTCKEVEIDCTK
ncbi:MAG TPA: hypothetical protein VGQ37_07250 [Vicinamibacterales bacterium]|nr:hypothetical protein [Vicinamibacterales bacterium]